MTAGRIRELSLRDFSQGLCNTTTTVKQLSHRTIRNVPKAFFLKLLLVKGFGFYRLMNINIQ